MQTKKTMPQRHRRLDGVQVHAAKGDVSRQRAMEEEDTLILILTNNSQSSSWSIA